MKKKREILTWALVLLVLAAGILLVFPYQKTISYHATDYAYCVDDPASQTPHEVMIEGTYIHYLLFDDVFQGTFFISGVDGLETGEDVRFHFDRRACLHPTFPDEYGQHMSAGIACIFAEPNFQTLAVQFSLTGESGETFLVPGAASYQEAYSAYTALLQKSGSTQ